jgi:hypothetical protein
VVSGKDSGIAATVQASDIGEANNKQAGIEIVQFNSNDVWFDRTNETFAEPLVTE